MNKSPFFSILVPTYNQVVYLPEAILSLRAQSFDDWEAMVVDDGSSDATVKELEHWTAVDQRIRGFRKQNGGVASALNYGLSRSRAEWICWLSSDDFFEPCALAEFSIQIRQNPGKRFFHSNFRILDQNKGVIYDPPNRDILPSPEEQTMAFMFGNYVHGISVCIHRSMFDEAGLFNESLRYAQDVDMWLRMSLRAPFVYMPVTTCITRVHTEAGTSILPDAGAYETAYICLEFLNRHSFPELFPLLDLDRLDHAVQAIKAALRVACNPQSHMYAGVGYVAALLERMGQWLIVQMTPEMRNLILPLLKEVVQAIDIQAEKLPRPLSDVLHKLLEDDPAPFTYSGYDPVKRMIRRLVSLPPGSSAEIQALSRYILTASPVLTRTSIFGATRVEPPEHFVNIGMVTYNRLEFTRKAIDALHKTAGYPFVLTVVDNGSTDGTREYLRELHEQGVISNLGLLRQNAGVAKASNLAWHAVLKARYYLKLDNDIVMQKIGWLADMVKVAECLSPGVGAVGYNFEPFSYPVVSCKGISVRPKEGNLGGACILIPGRIRDILGYWCEHYGLYGEEDADYGARILASGLLNVYMEDEDAGLHLPGNKAPYIDPTTLKAINMDSAEHDTIYQEWKDEQRRKNVLSGKLHRKISVYQTFPLRRFFPSQFIRNYNRYSQQYPDVSIIIPVYNQATYTAKCLTVLLTHSYAMPIEIIVVDNGSTDWTAEYLTTLGGRVSILTNSENMGFARACNQGAHVATGNLLLFLNNDTVAQPGWLDALARGIRQDNADIVGARLVYPNGKIQHAGIAFDSDSMPYHIFKKYPAADPAVMKKRFMKAVTAACMLVRRELFDALGGFDESFINGFEDVDFCLRAWMAGKKILYMPESLVIHYEETSEGRKTYEDDNMQRYLLRWWKFGLCDEEQYLC